MPLSVYPRDPTSKHGAGADLAVGLILYLICPLTFCWMWGKSWHSIWFAFTKSKFNTLRQLTRLICFFHCFPEHSDHGVPCQIPSKAMSNESGQQTARGQMPTCTKSAVPHPCPQPVELFQFMPAIWVRVFVGPCSLLRCLTWTHLSPALQLESPDNS